MSYSEAEKKESVQMMNTMIRELDLDIVELKPRRWSKKK
jgi:hypothetical protein